MNRSRFVREALGSAFGVLVAMKNSLDPQGILNVLGLSQNFSTQGHGCVSAQDRALGQLASLQTHHG